MSTFYTAFLVKKPVSTEILEKKFQNTYTTPESEWVVCNWSKECDNDLFEVGHYYTTELSTEIGEVIFVCENEREDQMEYEHSKNGDVLRKLSWISDGCRSTWVWIEGEMESWEESIIFSSANFDRTCETLKYDKHLNYIPKDEFNEKVNRLKEIWNNREYILESDLPLGNGTIPGAILMHLGLPTAHSFSNSKFGFLR